MDSSADTARLRQGYDWSTQSVGSEARVREEHDAAEQLFGVITREQLGIAGKEPFAHGGEHDVFTSKKSEHAGRVIKLTQSTGYNPANAGYCGREAIGAGGVGVIKMAPAMPSQYVQRLNKVNELFHDDVKILGVIRGAGGFKFATSQPYRTGDHPSTQEEITREMRQLGFALIKEDATTTMVMKGSSYYHEEKDIFISDARQLNFVRNSEGGLIPIDILCQRPNDELRQIIKNNLVQGEREAVEDPRQATLFDEVAKLREGGAPDAAQKADALVKQHATTPSVESVKTRAAVQSYMQGIADEGTVKKTLSTFEKNQAAARAQSTAQRNTTGPKV